MTYRIDVCVRRVSWLPPIWPNRVWLAATSPSTTTWQQAHHLAASFAEQGAIHVEVRKVQP